MDSRFCDTLGNGDQDYESKHPRDPYIRGVSLLRLKKFKKNYPEVLKDKKSH